MTSGNSRTRNVLISGASIAGPALAYWLHRYGFRVTVVEKASAPRSGGYPIDVRGTAIDVAAHMGILPRLQAAHVHTERITFLDPDGAEITTLAPHTLAGSVEGRDLEVRRGDLTAILYDTVRDDVEFRFDDSIDTLDQTDHGVDVTFRSGVHRTFDLVVGADGIHSHTRNLLFGPESRFHRHLGFRFAVFTMPNTLGLSRELLMWNAPGRSAALYATGTRDDDLHAFLNLHAPEGTAADGEPELPARRESAEPDTDLITSAFTDTAWQIPDIIDAMGRADDLFTDTVAQIHLPAWSTGRTALVGDAAYAPSFLTGQGTSLALVGAYMLAHALASHPTHTAALTAYDHTTRPFVTANQSLITHGSAALFPTTAQTLNDRNKRLQTLATLPTPTPRPAYTALTLPEPPPTP
ncbi:FAD-dependent monooxygenase [Glycomyces terrestris]|uniref:FAD-dependent oxidoreductase n=1 Tax=Glycomyces terrestris TaxID=2493553 RepID=A0A426URQ0_9ACTN|nr:FAD-dependent monooxygenase [Glycomyces terrestris]RRR95839.1 FAD-dependent oxidoreductase [Glycomyces terrestris]